MRICEEDNCLSARRFWVVVAFVVKYIPVCNGWKICYCDLFLTYYWTRVGELVALFREGQLFLTVRSIYGR
jgi:hypothetical protein